MLVYARYENEALRVCDIRSRVQDQFTTLDFAKCLWQLFRALISDALEGFSQKLGGTTDVIMQAIDDRVHDFFIQALQLGTFTLKMEFE